MTVEEVRLFQETLGMHPVVGVHARDVSAGTFGKTGVQGCTDPRRVRGDHADPWVGYCVSGCDGTRPVIRLTVDQNQFPSITMLMTYALHGFLQQGTFVMKRQQDGNSDGFHGRKGTGLQGE